MYADAVNKKKINRNLVATRKALQQIHILIQRVRRKDKWVAASKYAACKMALDSKHKFRSSFNKMKAELGDSEGGMYKL